MIFYENNREHTFNEFKPPVDPLFDTHPNFRSNVENLFVITNLYFTISYQLFFPGPDANLLYLLKTQWPSSFKEFRGKILRSVKVFIIE